jgi:hypothetical protein
VIPAAGGAERLVSSFGYEPRWSPDSTRILFKQSAVLPDLPTIYVVGLDGKPPRPVRPDVLDQFIFLRAAWHPDGRRVSIWGRTRTSAMKFLNLPLDGSRGDSPEMSQQVERDLASLSPGGFVWAKSRRHIYFEASAGDTRNVWRVTVDPRTESGSMGPSASDDGRRGRNECGCFAGREPAALHDDVEPTRVWAFPFDPVNGRIIGQPSPVTQGSSGEVDFDARADGSKMVYYTVRAGL